MNIRNLFSTMSLLSAALPFTANAGTGTAISIPGLYNTGVDNNGVVLLQQFLEQHYSVSGAATIAYIVPEVYNPSLGWTWHTAPAGSAWIGPNATSDTSPPDPVGTYHYTLSFDLTGYDPSQVRISGEWMSDNSAELLLNGNTTGFAKGPYGYYQLDGFVLTGGFNSGINTLEFRVLNEDIGPNPSGLCVAGLTATLVPEPAMSTLTLGLCALQAVSSFVGRRRQA